jgi:hypothetical protein
MSTAVVSPPRCSNAVYLPAAQVIWIRVQSRISQSWRDRTQHASIDLSPIDFVLKNLKERWPSVRGKGGISSPEENRGLPPAPHGPMFATPLPPSEIGRAGLSTENI